MQKSVDVETTLMSWCMKPWRRTCCRNHRNLQATPLPIRCPIRPLWLVLPVRRPFSVTATPASSRMVALRKTSARYGTATTRLLWCSSNNNNSSSSSSSSSSRNWTTRTSRCVRTIPYRYGRGNRRQKTTAETPVTDPISNSYIGCILNSLDSIH